MYRVKKGYLVENSINRYLQALYEIPDTFIVSTKIDIHEASYEKVVSLVENPPQPTEMIRTLMHED